MPASVAAPPSAQGTQGQTTPTNAGPAPDPGSAAPSQAAPSQPARSVSPNQLTNLLRSLTQRPKSPVSRTPDSYDGSDPKKLTQFLLQLSIYFQTHPRKFPDDQAKILFAISYLKGNALDWFGPGMTEMEESGISPDWYDSYGDFARELRDNFGEHDPTGTAESKLSALRMKDSQRFTEYLVKFNQLAIQTGWSEDALRFRLYDGLPDRLKDEISRFGKPATLTELRTCIRTLDSRHWERQAEKRRNNPNPPTKSNDKRPDNSARSGNNHNKSSNSRPSNSNSNSKSSNSGSNNSASASSSSANRSSNMDNKLGKDGKLTEAERKRRLENKLCLFCGRSGHMARECPKSTSSAAKARASKTSDAPAAPTPGKA